MTNVSHSHRTARSTALDRAARMTLEQLEGRRYLCGLPHEFLIAPPVWSEAIEAQYAPAGPDSPDATSIVWTNRGQASDGFAAAFGTSAAAGRAVVDAALEHWERVITDWNRANGTTTLQVTVSIAGTGFGGAAAPDAVAPADGKPIAGGITLGAGDTVNFPSANDSNGWYFDGNPDAHGEFDGTIVNAFAGQGTNLGPDFYSVAVAELTHVLGLISDQNNSGGSFDGYLLESSGFATDTNIADTAEGNGNGEFWVFEGPTIDHLMTSFNSGNPTAQSWGNIVHSAGPGGGFVFNNKTWQGSDDAGNAFYNGNSERTLPSFAMAHVLADAYGYDIVDPETFGTFYALLNGTSGELLIRGGATTSEDVVTVTFDEVNDNYIVSVDVGNDPAGTGAFSGSQDLPAWVSVFTAAEVSSILIEPGDGDDNIFINGGEAPVTVNAGGGDDFISVGGGDLDSNLEGSVTVNGEDDADTLWFDDTDDTAGGDDYLLTTNRLEKNDDEQVIFYATTETLFLLGSAQASTYDIPFLPAGINNCSIFGGAGNETFTVASGDIDTNLDSDLNLFGGGGDDALIFNDTTDGVNSDLYELSEFQLTKSPGGSNRTVEFSGMNSLLVDGSNQTNTWNVLGVATGLPTTLNGGSGNDTFNVADDDLDSDIKSNVTINGNDGTDTINFDDSGDAAGNDTYTVGQLVFSKDVRDFRYGTVEAINLTGSPQNDDVQLNGSPAGTLITLSSGAGNDDFILGNNDLGTVLTGFVLQGQGGTDTLAINDGTDTEDDTYTLTSSTFAKTFVNGNSRQFAQFAGMEELALVANPANNTINVHSTGAGTPVTVFGGDGNDTFHVGLNDSVAGILGSVLVDGFVGTDKLFYNDELNAADHAYTVAPNDLIRDGVANVVPHVDEIVVHAGSGSNVISVPSNNAQTTINGHGGDDTFRVATGLWDTGVQGPVKVNGGPGTDGLVIDDRNDTGADGYTIDALQTTKTAAFAGAISYDTIESYQLDANRDANVITVNGTFDGDFTLRGRTGADEFILIDNFAGRAVTIDGGAELDVVRVNSDSAGTAAAQFASNQDLATLSISNGGTATVTPGADKVIVTGSIAIGATGALDITDNGVILDWTIASPINVIRNFITTGYNGGLWNGNGIRSSTAAAGTSTAVGYAESTELFSVFPASFLNQPVDASAILLKHTFYGDANLNGNVNLGDFNRLAANFGLTTGARWSQGNFDFNENVNLSDFNKLAANFGSSAAGTGGGEDEMLPSIEDLLRRGQAGAGGQKSSAT